MQRIAIKHDEGLSESDIINNDIIVVNITKADVVNGNMFYIENIIAKLKECSGNAKQKVLLLFSGYDDTPEEIYEITAIRNWVRKVVDKHPYFFYFITPFDNNAGIIAACLGDVCRVKFGPAMSLSEYIKVGADPQNAKVLVKVDIPADLSRHIVYGTLEYAITTMDPQSGFDVLAGIPGLKSKTKKTK